MDFIDSGKWIIHIDYCIRVLQKNRTNRIYVDT